MASISASEPHHPRRIPGVSPQVFTQGQGQPVEQWEFDRAQARIKNPKVDPRRVEQIAAKLKVTTPQYELLDR